jgi:hypothetical protein
MIRWVTAVRVCGPGVSGTLSMMAAAGAEPRGRGRGGAGAAWPALFSRACGPRVPGNCRWNGIVPMLPDATLPLPASLASLPAVFGPLFTAPTFRTFTALACGFLAQTGKRTMCGMLAGAGLSLLVPTGEPVTVAIDDTLVKRRGKKVVGSVVVPRRIRAGTCENGIRQQLGGRRDRGTAADDQQARRHPRCWLSW